MTKLIEFFRRSGKIPAFLIHLGISVLLVASLAAMVFVYWYPPPYFEYDGAKNVMRLVIFVDVVLGPLLTLMLFQRGKKGLVRDLGIIASVQLVAFVYGAGVMMQYRPAFIVFADDAFYAVRWPDLAPHTKDHARLEQMRTSIGPTFVVLDLPADRTERHRLFVDMANGGVPVSLLGDRYQPMTAERWRPIFEKSADLKAQSDWSEPFAQFQERDVAKAQIAVDNLAFIPAFLRNGLVMFAIDRTSGTLFGSISNEKSAQSGS
jgi:hypothetical protein